MAKVCQGEHAEVFAGEVHTDLWGPSLIPTLSAPPMPRERGVPSLQGL